MKNKLLLLFLCCSNVFWCQIPLDSIPYEERNFSENVQEKYSGSDFNYEMKVAVEDMNAWDRFWAAVKRFFESLFNFGGSGTTMSVFEIIMKIIAIVIVLFVVYLIVKVIINKEGGWIFSKASKNTIPVKEWEENIHQLDFQSLILTAKQSNNNRLVIRYYYLWLLKSLTDRNIIEWDIEKTNSDYSREIKDQKLKQDFQFVSYIFEYSWYGEFDMKETDFSKAENAFLKLIAKA